MIHVNKLTYFHRVRQRQTICHGPIETFATTGGYNKILGYYQDERVKPPNPLWRYPTNWPARYLRDVVYGIWHPAETQCTWTDEDGHTHPNGTVFNDYVWVPNVNPYPPLETYWATALRLHIKDTFVNLGTHLVEYRESAKMFASAASGMAYAWKKFRGKKPSRRRLRPCDVPAYVLGYNYGVGPLVSDVYKATEMLQTRFTEDIIRRVVITRSDRYNGQDPKESKYIRNLYAYKGDRAICYLKLKPHWQSYVTLGNPLELAWEVIPYSFVVDWMFSVGDFLQSLDALKAWNIEAGTLTTKKRMTQDPSNYYPSGGYWKQRPSIRQKDYVRVVLNGIPIDLPRWDPSRSWRTLVNAVSLLAVTHKPLCKGK